MNKELIHFLLQLAKDPDRQEAFHDNYRVAVRAQPISSDLRRMLLALRSEEEAWNLVRKASAPHRDDLRHQLMQFQHLSSPPHHNDDGGNGDGPQTHSLVHGGSGPQRQPHRESPWPRPPNPDAQPASGHTLIMAGTGIKAVGHLTQETIFWLKRADKVLFSLTDEIVTSYIRELQPGAESLNRFYAEDRPRARTYRLMANRILECAREYETVCVAFYGHPQVLVDPVARAGASAAKLGHRVMVLPGVSSLACLFADLGLDIAHDGLQSYEAGDFVVRPRPFDPYTPLVLWQAAALGDSSWSGRDGSSQPHVPLLTAILAEQYGGDHEILVYEAQVLPFEDYTLRRGTIFDLSKGILSDGALLYVPAKETAPVDRNILRRLGMLENDD